MPVDPSVRSESTRSGRLRQVLGDLGILRHYPVVAIAVLAAGVVVGLTATMGPLFRGSGGDATIRQEIAVADPGALGLTIAGSAGGGSGLTPEAADAATSTVLTALDTLDRSGQPVATQRANGRVQLSAGDATTTPAFMLWRSDFHQHIDIVADAGIEGLWLPDATAQAIGAQLGAPVDIGDTTVPLAGTYQDLRTTDATQLDAFWQPLAGLFRLPPDAMEGIGPPAPIATALLDRPTAMQLREGPRPWLLTFEARYDAPAAITLEEARSDARAATLLRRRALDPDAQLGGALEVLGVSAPDVTSSLSGAVRRSDDVVTTITAPVTLLTAFGLLVGLVVVAAAMTFSGDARRRELALRTSQGRSPARQAAQTAREVAIPLINGTVLGAALGVLTVTLIGPAGTPPVAAAAPAVLALGVGFTAALGVAAAATAVQVVRIAAPPPSEPQRQRSVPWELVTGSLAAAAGYQVLTRGDALAIGSDGALRIDALILAFPLLAIITAVGIGARGLRRVLRHAARIPSRGRPVVLLASRRLAAATGTAVALVGSAGLAAGLLVYATTSVASTELTIDAKRSVAAGAELIVTTFDGLDLSGIDVGAAATPVSRASARLEPAAAEVEVMAIDPATFASVARLDERWLGTDPDALLALLADPAGPGGLTAVGVGLPGGADRLILGPIADTTIDVAVTVPAFPGLPSDRPLVVVGRDALAGVAEHPDDVANRMRQELWVDSADPVVVGTAAALGGAQPILGEAIITSSGLDAYAWTLDLLQALAGLGVVLAVAGLALFLRARQRERAVAYALATRMGMTSRQGRRAIVAELGVLLGAAAAVGLVAALVAAQVTLTSTDPLPDIPPAPLLDISVGVLVSVPLAVALAALAAGWWSQRLADRARAAEVLRLAD